MSVSFFPWLLGAIAWFGQSEGCWAQHVSSECLHCRENASEGSPRGPFAILAREICLLPTQFTSRPATLLKAFWGLNTTVGVFVRDVRESRGEFAFYTFPCNSALKLQLAGQFLTLRTSQGVAPDVVCGACACLRLHRWRKLLAVCQLLFLLGVAHQELVAWKEVV